MIYLDMEEKPVLLVDNTSPISCIFMRYIINIGGFDKFNFLSLKSEESKNLLSQYNVLNSKRRVLILVENGMIFTDTLAFLKSASKISGFIPLLYWYDYTPVKS